MRFRVEHLDLVNGQWIDSGSEYARWTDAIAAARLAKRLTGHDCKVVDAYDRSPWLAVCWHV